MAVVIWNISEKRGLEYGKGKQIYELSINGIKKFGEFEHNFEDGLSVCLEKAAKCAKQYEEKEGKH